MPSKLLQRCGCFLAVLVLFICYQGLSAQNSGQVPAKTVPLSPLPAPSGPHQIGTTAVHMVDRARPDSISKRAGAVREWMAQLWYPAGSTGPLAPYVVDPGLMRAIASTDGGYYGQSAETMKFWQALSTHSVLNALPLKGKSRFPLLVFSPGLGMSRINYTAIAEQLASYGYVVAAVDHPYEGVTVLPDGRVLSADDDPTNAEEAQMPAHLDQMVQDARFVVNQLGTPATSPLHMDQVIDFKNVGMLGHSLGGAAALQACLADPQFKACADLDGAPFGKVLEQGAAKPTMLLLEDPDYSDADLAAKGRTRAQWEEMGKKGTAMWAAVGKNKAVPVYKVKIRGTGHLSFSDAPFVMPDTITRFGGHILPPEEAYQQVTSYLLGFFDQYLKGKPSPLLAKAQKL